MADPRENAYGLLSPLVSFCVPFIKKKFVKFWKGGEIAGDSSARVASRTKKETGPYKDNEVRGSRDSLQVVPSTSFRRDPVTFYART